MNDILSNQNIMIALISAIITLIVSAITYGLFKNIKTTRYDQKERFIQMDEMRSSLEKELYKINERLMMNEVRWRDVNHLFLRKELEDKNINKIGTLKQVHFNDFLKSNGITEKDIIIEKNFVFVLTPFHNQFLEDFNTIKNICSNVGLKCQRGDENFHKGDIFSQMLKNIVKANLIIANINGRNPNVLYELGIAQALDKPTIFIAKTIEDIPIDIKSKRFIIYKSNNELESLLKAELLRIFVEKQSNILEQNSNELNEQQTTIEILNAIYGTENNSFDITNEIRKYIKNNRLEVSISDEIGGDPEPGSVKTLDIYYKIGAKQFNRKVRQGTMLIIQG